MPRAICDLNHPILMILRFSAIFSIHVIIWRNQAPSGSCALVAVLGGERIYVAHVGDSRAVLCSGARGEATALTKDHKPDGTEERTPPPRPPTPPHLNPPNPPPHPPKPPPHPL